jgi:hypothetical protein
VSARLTNVVLLKKSWGDDKPQDAEVVEDDDSLE